MVVLAIRLAHWRAKVTSSCMLLGGNASAPGEQMAALGSGHELKARPHTAGLPALLYHTGGAKQYFFKFRRGEELGVGYRIGRGAVPIQVVALRCCSTEQQ